MTIIWPCPLKQVSWEECHIQAKYCEHLIPFGCFTFTLRGKLGTSHRRGCLTQWDTNSNFFKISWKPNKINENLGAPFSQPLTSTHGLKILRIWHKSCKYVFVPSSEPLGQWIYTARLQNITFLSFHKLSASETSVEEQDHCIKFKTFF